MGLPALVVNNLSRLGIVVPTDIQRESIPAAIDGRDVLASSKTGSGKTLAYLLPAINKVLAEKAKILVLVPTRELAVQVVAAMRQVTGGIRLSGAVVIGGEPFGKQVSQLAANPDVVVATPGRLIDHMNRGTVKVGQFDYLVLDEMDRMLDMGMKEQIAEINRYLPEHRQVLMFSATMPRHIREVSHKYLTNPHKVTIGKANEAAPEIEQEFINVKEAAKYTELDSHLTSKEGTVIVFVKTKRGADKLAHNLKIGGHRAESIHGDLTQGRRLKVLNNFRSGRTRILVATDVAARGLDVDHVKYVFNYDLPSCPEDYLHRIGRTGRAGAKGFAISFVADVDMDRKRAIDRLIAKGESTRESFKKPGGGRGSERRSGAKFGRKSDHNRSSAGAGRSGRFGKKRNNPRAA